MMKFWSICRVTFLQTIRQNVYLVVLLATMGVLVLTLPMTGWTLGGSGQDYHETDQKMLEGLGLGTLLWSGLLLAAFSASTALSREIEERTVLTVISKPVSRVTFVLGKFGGVWAAVALAYYLASLVFFMTVRHKVMSAVGDPYDLPVIVLGGGAFLAAMIVAVMGNYFFGWTFASAVVWSCLVSLSAGMALIAFLGKDWAVVPFGTDIGALVLTAVVLIFLAVMLFVAVAVAASTRLGAVLTLLVCLAVVVAGWMHPRMFNEDTNDIFVVRVLGWIVPDLSLLDPQDALAMDKAIPLSYVGLAAGYTALYVAGVLAAGVAMFQRRSLEAQTSSGAMPGVVAVLAWTGRAAAVVLALVALVLIELPAYHRSVGGVAICAALLAGGVALWMLWGFFGRGAAWSYWLTAVLSGAALAFSLTAYLVPQAANILQPQADRVLLLSQTAVCAIVLMLLVLPKTRRHFKSARL